MAGQHYVYLHRKATDGTVFYVGKGKDRRAWATTGRNPWWKHTQKKHGFTVEIVKSGLSEHCALAFERIAISRIGIANLANLVEGGGGTQGWKHSDEAKARISEAGKGRPRTDRQREAFAAVNRMERGPEQRRKMSESAKLRVGRAHSKETRAKIAASHMGVRPSAETLRKMSLSKIGKACGRDGPTYDHKVRTFEHPEQGQFVGTRADFIATFKLRDGCVSRLISGRGKSVKQWRLK